MMDVTMARKSRGSNLAERSAGGFATAVWWVGVDGRNEPSRLWSNLLRRSAATGASGRLPACSWSDSGRDGSGSRMSRSNDLSSPIQGVPAPSLRGPVPRGPKAERRQRAKDAKARLEAHDPLSSGSRVHRGHYSRCPASRGRPWRQVLFGVSSNPDATDRSCPSQVALTRGWFPSEEQ